MKHRFDLLTMAKVGALLGVTALLGACASLNPAPPEERVKELATQRWQALVSGNYSAAYDFAVPSYRQINTRDYYVNKQRNAGVVKWLSATVVRVSCEPTRCKTTTELVSQPLVPGFRGTLKQGIEETWVFEGGRWWFLESL